MDQRKRIEEMEKLGFHTYIDRKHQGPIITTFFYPENCNYTFAEMYEFTGMDLYLEYAKRSAARVIADSAEEKGKRCFYGFWDRTNPRDVQTYTGLYTGASGVGANILKLYAVLNKTAVTDFWEYSYLE